MPKDLLSTDYALRGQDAISKLAIFIEYNIIKIVKKKVSLKVELNLQAACLEGSGNLSGSILDFVSAVLKEI